MCSELSIGKLGSARAGWMKNGPDLNRLFCSASMSAPAYKRALEARR